MLSLFINLLIFLLITFNPVEGKANGEGGESPPVGSWWNPDFQEEFDDYGNPQPTPPPQQPPHSNLLPPNPTQISNNDLFQTQGPPTIPPPTPPPQYPYRQITFPPVSSMSFSVDARRRSSKNGKSKVSSILVGDICDPTDPVYNKCSGNAECVLIESENLYKCNCSYSYEITSTKKCLRSWGSYCDAKDPCNHESFLSCVDNRCECGNSEVYQNAPDRCKSKVGGPCSTSVGPECVANAICLSFDRYGRASRCVCRDGFVETTSGACSPGVGMPCHGKGECNPEIPLVCKEGMCACREAVHTYDLETNSCVGLVGAQCCTNFDGVDCPYNITNGCVSGAFCKKMSRNLPGRCQCQSFNLESDERSCSPNPTFGQLVSGGKVY